MDNMTPAKAKELVAETKWHLETKDDEPILVANNPKASDFDLLRAVQHLGIKKTAYSAHPEIANFSVSGEAAIGKLVAAGADFPEKDQFGTKHVEPESEAVKKAIELSKTSGKPVLFVVSREGCGDCDNFKPKLEAVEKAFGDNITVVHLHSPAVRRTEHTAEVMAALGDFAKQGRDGFPAGALFVDGEQALLLPSDSRLGDSMYSANTLAREIKAVSGVDYDPQVFPRAGAAIAS